MKKVLFNVLLLLMMAIGAVAQETTLTVCDGTTTNSYVPFNGLYADYGTRSQFVLPSEELSDMEGGSISQLTFYCSQVSLTFDQEVTVYLKEVDYTTFASATLEDWDNMTTVYAGTIGVSDNHQMEISFSTPYTYSGGNLMIGFQVTAWGSSCPSSSWYGVNQSSGNYTAVYNNANSSHVWSSTISRQNFLPKTTFTYTPGAAPSCTKVNNLAANNLTSSSADITWEAGGTETAWVLKYGTTGFDVETEGTPEDISTNPAFQITGLSANTSYDAYVKAVCGVGDESAWKKVTFRTECGIENVPYTENFESFGAGTVPSCWDNSASTTSTIGSSPSYVWGVYSYNDNKMLRMYNYYVNSGTALINTPSISIPADGVYQLVFEYSHTASCGAFDVKISEDGGSSFVVLGSYAKVGTSTSYSDPGTFTEVEPISLAAYAGKTVMLQFFANADYSSGAIFVDNISIALAPSCMKPTALSSSNVTARTADLSWTAGGDETAWQICLNDNESNPIDATNPFTLTGLEPTTTYNVKVRANCGGSDGDSEWTNNISFTTTVSCPAPINLAVSGLTPTSATIEWEAGAFETEWNLKYKADGDGDWTVENDVTSPYTITGLTAETDYEVQLQAVCALDDLSDWSSSVDVYTGYCQPAPTSRDGNGITGVSFGSGDDIVSNSNSNGLPAASPYYGDYTNLVGAVQAGVEATVSITYATGWTYGTIIWIDLNNNLIFEGNEVVYVGECASSNPTTLAATFTLPISIPAGDYRMRIAAADSYYDSYIASIAAAANANPCPSTTYTVVNDYTIRVLAAPTCFPPTALTASSIGATTATLTWTAGNGETAWQVCINGDEGNLIDVDAPTYTMENLIAATDYTVKVRSNCGSDGVSAWSSEYEFTTEICDAIDMCQIRFDLTDSYGDSWNGNAIKVTDVATGIVLGTFANENLNGTSGSGENELNTLYLAVCNGSELQFSWVSGSYASEASYVVYDALGTEIFSGSGALTTTTHTVTCPSCYMPTALTASSVGASTATLTWTAGRSEENWILQYGTDDTFAENTEVEISTTPTANLTGLDATTTYYVRIKSDCGSDGESVWTSVYEFTTSMCEVEDQCLITYYLEDSYDDGWEGSVINVVDVATSDILATWTVTESSASGTLSVCNGREISFEWVNGGGSWDSDASYVVTDLNGTVIFEGSGAMDDDVTYTVDCTIKHTITASTADLNGTITPDGENLVVDGENLSFTIVPADDCYYIASVLVDGVEAITDVVDGVYTFENVTANHTIAATFAVDTYNITTSVEGNGTITETSTVNCGDDKQITITPANDCYRIASVMVDGVEAITDVVDGVYT
ncbi:MAG: fibronectin type III domain-containing protein, partial [Bacteroidales bacterium]|nr:fibronectin type III domain-containing protein [Bacteroidales bacterium]